MAYQKIVVNTNLALNVIASDTNHIPALPSVGRITGVGKAVVTGVTNGSGTNELVDTTQNFLKAVSPFPVVVGDVVYNLTVPANQPATDVTATIITMGAGNIFNNAAGGEDYQVLRSNVLIDGDNNFETLGVQDGDIVFNTTTNTQALITSVDGFQLTLDTDIFGSATSFNDTYSVFVSSGPGVQSTVMQSADCCLLYVGSSEATMTAATSFVDVRVLTCGDDIVTFSNFRVGDYLPIQIKQLFDTGTDPAAKSSCLAIW